MKHGTVSTYNNHGCRCEQCKIAARAYARVYRESKRHGFPKEPEPQPVEPSRWHEHGTRSAYLYHRCRCDECRTANASYMKDLRSRHANGGYISYVHGTRGRYGQGCRCVICVRVAALYDPEIEVIESDD